MKEENELLNKIGKDNPFLVSEGYFDHFTTELMNKLPEKDEPQSGIRKPTVWRKVRPWIYVAAMLVGVAFMVKMFVGDSALPEDKANTEVTIAAAAETDYDEYIDYAVSQSMLDEYSLYIYLTDANMD